jgi:site-specific recombinase XerD
VKKKKRILSIETDLSDVLNKSYKHSPHNDKLTIEGALTTVVRQMEVSGYRPRTINDYILHVNNYKRVTGATFIEDITVESIYEWLASMNVVNQTRLTRLKCLKAFLTRCFENGWIASKFWTNVKVKVDSKVKEGTTERDMNLLLSILDLNDFVQLRDGTAALLMYKTGIRLNTLTLLENRHIDFENKLLKLEGRIMKNRDQLLLPFDNVLHRLLSILIKQNQLIRCEYEKDNSYVFITKVGDMISNGPTNNNIPKKLNKYAKQYGIKNISPHALRRGFAKNLYNKGANIALISRALGHSNIAVTSQYLHIDKNEIADNLRNFLD